MKHPTHPKQRLRTPYQQKVDSYQAQGYKIETIPRKKLKRDRIYDEYHYCGICNKYFKGIHQREKIYIIRKVILNTTAAPIVDLCCSEKCSTMYLLGNI